LEGVGIIKKFSKNIIQLKEQQNEEKIDEEFC